jgi:hypothetical protein
MQRSVHANNVSAAFSAAGILRCQIVQMYYYEWILGLSFNAPNKGLQIELINSI